MSITEPEVQDVFYCSWNHKVGTHMPFDGESNLTASDFKIALAGVGAVGCAWLHSIWACEIRGQAVIADGDEEGVDITNLNRYVLFGRSDLGRPKASTAAELLQDSTVEWAPKDDRLDRDIATLKDFDLILSAVDTNQSRRALQALVPRVALSASTSRLRAEVSRTGPPGIGACLACYNPDELVESDPSVRQRLREMSIDERRAFADAYKIGLDALEAYLIKPECGEIESRVLAAARAGSPQAPQFAVGFVSTMAGVLLAAETVKEVSGLPGPLDETNARTVFQFENPSAESNGFTRHVRDPRCVVCKTGGAVLEVWKARYPTSRSTQVDPERG
jgi:molybdopterin/thiamine biosynthesis adenylyltransferase